MCVPATLVRSITTYTDYGICNFFVHKTIYETTTYEMEEFIFKTNDRMQLINAFVIHIRISKRVDMWFIWYFLILVLVFMNQLSFMLYYLFLMNSS